MSMELSKIKITQDGTHHLLAGEPLYTQRFLAVLKFHPPGLAAVLDRTGAYHIDLNGNPVYSQRYLRSFGFYAERAAVIPQDTKAWFHIFPSGQKVYTATYSWCGNFQDGACVVRDNAGYYFHIDLEGVPLYHQKYNYGGDFKDGIAMVQNQQGLYTHIYRDGNQVHNRWFYDLDIFHKGFARARDSRGWYHITKNGQQVYRARYKMVEPFYNGLARVEDNYGAMLLINEEGEVTKVLRDKQQTPLQQLSADLVGYWKTQTIKAAVELKLFEFLPSDNATLSIKTNLSLDMSTRLLRALQELGLVYEDNSLFFPTDKGKLLQKDKEISLAAAAIHWAAEPYLIWLDLVAALKSGQQKYAQRYGTSIFAWLEQDKNNLQLYQRAMVAYAKHDYQDIAEKIDWSKSRIVIDAGGGQGILLDYILQKYSHITGILLERAAVIENMQAMVSKERKFSLVAFDLFTKWPRSGEVILLARILHDWDNSRCVAILRRAKEALFPGGFICLIEMLLKEDSSNGGMLDLNMLVLTGGMERTAEQFRELAKQAELKVAAIDYLSSGYAILKLLPLDSDK